MTEFKTFTYVHYNNRLENNKQLDSLIDDLNDGWEIVSSESVQIAFPAGLQGSIIYVLKKEYNPIGIQNDDENKLLELLKKKKVDLDLLARTQDVERYNVFISDDQELTVEEFNIVKKWLGN